MTSTTNSQPCNFVFYFLLLLLAITSFGFGSFYTENRYLKKGGSGSEVANTDPTAQAPEQQAPPEIDPTKVPEISDSDWVKGNASAKVALIEYSDFECPFCQSFHPTINQALEEYPNDLKVVFRHFPLSFHQNAQKYANAAECMAESGGSAAFWAFADNIFGLAQGTVPDLDKIIGELGYDVATINSCITSAKFADKIKEQQDAGTAANVSGTPGVVIINTETKEAKVLPGAVPFADVKAAIDEVLN